MYVCVCVLAVCWVFGRGCSELRLFYAKQEIQIGLQMSVQIQMSDMFISFIICIFL